MTIMDRIRERRVSLRLTTSDREILSWFGVPKSPKAPADQSPPIGFPSPETAGAPIKETRS